MDDHDLYARIFGIVRLPEAVSDGSSESKQPDMLDSTNVEGHSRRLRQRIDQQQQDTNSVEPRHPLSIQHQPAEQRTNDPSNWFSDVLLTPQEEHRAPELPKSMIGNVVTDVISNLGKEVDDDTLLSDFSPTEVEAILGADSSIESNGTGFKDSDFDPISIGQSNGCTSSSERVTFPARPLHVENEFPMISTTTCYYPLSVDFSTLAGNENPV